MGSLLVCSWAHSVGKNHFFIMMFFNRDSTIQSASKKFCTDYKSENSVPYQPSRRRVIPFGRPAIQSTIHPDNVDFRPDAKVFVASIRLDDENFPSELSSVLRSFELLQLASVRTFQQPVPTTFSVRSKLQDFFPNTNMGRLL
jgi:hypothetical protein